MERNNVASLLAMVIIASGVSSVTTFQVTSMMLASPDGNDATIYYNETLNYYNNTCFNGTTVEHCFLQTSVMCTMTRTFFEVLNVSLSRELTIKGVYAKINTSITSGSVTFLFRSFVNGSEITYGSVPSHSFLTEPSVVNVWQIPTSSTMFMLGEWNFDVNDQCVVIFGVNVYDGLGTPNPINLGVELMILYDVE